MSSSKTDQFDWSSGFARWNDRPAFRGLPLSCSRQPSHLLRPPDVAANGGGRVDETQTRVRLEGMRMEHRDLDNAITALALASIPDQLQMARLKKRKLRLRDEIASLEDMLIPDIIA